MTSYDVFNGDADGLCALQQLRLAAPRDAVLVTGVKRDIGLLARVPAGAGDQVTALDIAAAENHAALVALLQRGAQVEYFDHHDPGDLPAHPNLTATIVPRPEVCTGILVDRFLGGRHRRWAIVAAFGDNLVAAASALAARMRLEPPTVAQLRELGEVLNYNAYGDALSDLAIDPAELAVRLRPHRDPADFVAAEPMFAQLAAARRDDLARAEALRPAFAAGAARAYVLPDAAWSRRVRGTLGNDLANARPDLAHAIATPNADGSYTVSVRAPRTRPTGADALCRAFGGNGRPAAAGVNALPADRLDAFMAALAHAYA